MFGLDQTKEKLVLPDHLLKPSLKKHSKLLEIMEVVAVVVVAAKKKRMQISFPLSTQLRKLLNGGNRMEMDTGTLARVPITDSSSIRSTTPNHVLTRCGIRSPGNSALRKAFMEIPHAQSRAAQLATAHGFATTSNPLLEPRTCG